MASRDITQYRSVTQVVAEDVAAPTDGKTLEAIATIGQNIIKSNQQAKITENFSMAQMDINRLNTQYQVDYEGDPFGGLDKLKTEQNKILENYGKDISPFFKKDWNTNTRELSFKSNAEVEGWAYKQTRVNTVASINRTIKNNMSQATTDGQNFGNSDSDEITSMLNFDLSKSKLANFGDANLGAETTTSMLEGYDEDYLKSFISGVSETNPLKALRLMDQDAVKGGFKDQKQYSKMKEAVENRALNVQQIMGERQVLNTLKDENSLLVKSLEAPISYSELQQEFDRTKMSPAAQSFFMKANGYTKADGTANDKLSPSEKLQGKVDLYDQITQATSSPEFGASDIARLQNSVYSAMDSKAIDEKEGINLLSQLVAPAIAAKEEQFGKYQIGKNNPFQENIGFSGMQEMYKNEIEIPPADGEDDVGPQTKLLNDTNKVKLYDYYMSSLAENAQSYGVAVGDIPKLGKPQQRKLYTEAQAQAKTNFLLDTNPALSTLKDMPNQILQGGKLIQGAAGTRDLKPDVAAKPSFQMQIGSDGYLYRLYPDGMRERAGKAPTGVKY